MARIGSRPGKRTWRNVVVGAAAGVLVLGLIVFWGRFRIAVWYLEGNRKAQELVILEMLEIAKPVIERDFTMTLPEKILSALTGKRNEKERQTDALRDVRTFGEMSFEKHRLKFINVHNLGTWNGFELRGYDFALGWDQGNGGEVLAAFNVNFLKREIGRMEINPDCSFFTALRLFLEKKAKAD